jgi:hypothetical protein
MNRDRQYSFKVAMRRIGATNIAVEKRNLLYTKTCLKRNATVLVFFSVFTGFRFTTGCVLIQQSTKNMIA